MASWYYVKEGERRGPVDRTEIDARIADGVVRPDTLVWRVGMASWARADTLSELGLPPPAMPPPLPPVESEAPDPTPTFPADSPRERALAEARAACPPEYAGFWARVAAKLLDGVVLYAAGMVVERMAISLWLDGVAPESSDWIGLLRLMAMTAPFNLAIAMIYSVYFQIRHEATPGKLLLGLRVVRANGARVLGWRALGRYWAEQLSGLLFCVGYVMAAFDDEKRALHDYLCDTRVVKGRREEE